MQRGQRSRRRIFNLKRVKVSFFHVLSRFRDFNQRSTAVRFVGISTILQFRSLFHLLYRPSYVTLPLFPIYVTDRSYISGVLHYRYFRSFTGASGGSIYHRKCLSCRYNRNCSRGRSMGEPVSYIDTNERRTHRE